MTELLSPNSKPRADDRQTLGSEAGVYEYFLGGRVLPTAMDSSIARQAIGDAPEAVFAARENRRFVGRAGRALVDLGIRQFIDVGCGYPTHEPLHEAVLDAAPDSRVIYVDYNPAVAAYASEHVDVPGDRVRWITVNLRRPWEIAVHPELTGLIDLDRPVAVIMAAVLHFVREIPESPGEAGAFRIAEWWRDRIAPGSYLVISHAVSGADPEGAERAASAWDRSRSSLIIRTPTQVDELFIGCELLPPGLVSTTEWGTGEPAPADEAVIFAGVGRVSGRRGGP